MAVIGIDETGRGVWAGPFMVAGVRTPDQLPEWWDQLRDSKQLSDKRRQELAKLIYEYGFKYYVRSFSPATVDELGLSECMRTAVTEIVRQLHQPGDTVVVDGSVAYGYAAVVRADDLFKEVSAASILAKVKRDEVMRAAVHTTFPQYGFNNHVGYGTLEHREALEKHGPLNGVHRFSVRPVREAAGVRRA